MTKRGEAITLAQKVAKQRQKKAQDARKLAELHPTWADQYLDRARFWEAAAARAARGDTAAVVPPEEVFPIPQRDDDPVHVEPILREQVDEIADNALAILRSAASGRTKLDRRERRFVMATLGAALDFILAEDGQ